MPMPSLLKYFAFVGAALLGLLSLANFLLDPSTGATQVAAAPAKPTLAVRHDPRASKIERWRDDQAALKAAPQTQTSQNASLVTKSTAEPPRPATIATVEQAKPQPAPQAAAVAPEPAKPQPAAATAAEAAPIVGAESTDEIAAAHAAKAAERKAKVAKAKARRERLARERNTPRERYAANQQDQFYYAQRGQPSFGTHDSSAYAPQPSFGPFGWGRTW